MQRRGDEGHGGLSRALLEGAAMNLPKMICALAVSLSLMRPALAATPFANDGGPLALDGGVSISERVGIDAVTFVPYALFNAAWCSMRSRYW